jgi:ketosteroid isomerase-like protein
MMSATRLVVPILAAFAIAGCAANTSNATQNNDADVKAIDAVREHELTVMKAGSVDSMGAIYSDDVDFMSPGEPAVHGLDAAKKWVQTMFSQVNMSGNYTSSQVTVSGDLAVDRYAGTISTTPKAGGPAMTETIKGVHVLKRQPGGGWKIVLDIYNADAPETPPAAGAAGNAKTETPKKK